MSGNLSITPKHGRAPGKTYGVNRSFIRTMVTAVLVLCITITCTTSALAGDDVDFYPGEFSGWFSRCVLCLPLEDREMIGKVVALLNQ